MTRAPFYIGLFCALIALPLTGQREATTSYVAAELANDVFYLPLRTDRYFTSGMRFEYGRTVPAPEWKGTGVNTTRYWRLDYDLYTPVAIDSVELQPQDRPFASYLTLTRGKRFYNAPLGFTLDQAWTVGILGKYSGGGKMQNAFHDMVNFAERIPGWTYEIKPDAILNYRLRVGQRFAVSRRLAVVPLAEFRLGTLHTDAAAGMELDLTPLRFSPVRYLQLRMATDTRLVGYNATLSGGLLNRDDRYRGVIEPRRLVGRLRWEAELRYDGWKLSGGTVYLSPEFVGGEDHLWAWFRVLRAW